mmetsp:Transcript_24358/g.50656  ORF Transcript_24358/g.50656 Transcript_24358/m.50656 type:complete len:468 (-) Transcript_24358:112-1515(-)
MASKPCCLAWTVCLPVVAAFPQTLRIAAFPSTVLPWFIRDEQTGEYTGGFVTEVWRELGASGNFDYELVPMEDPSFLDNVDGQSKTLLDMNVIDVAFSWETTLSPHYVYSQPLAAQKHVILTKRINVATSIWQVFAPFKLELWCMMAASIIIGAFMMFLMNRIACADAIGFCSLRGFPSFVYHTAAALLGGDEYDLYHYPAIGRLYRLGLLFLVLVSSATYTANLAAYMTRQNFRVLGPKTMEELQRARVCLRRPAGREDFREFVPESQMIFPSPGMSLPQRLTWAQSMLQEEECDAIIEQDGIAHGEALEHCSTMELNPDIAFGHHYVYHVLRFNDTELANNISTGILKLMEGSKYPRLLEHTMNIGRSCREESNEDDDLESNRISIQQMGVAFIVFGACGTLAIVTVAVQRVLNGGKPLIDVKEEVQNEKLDTKMDLLLAEVRALSADKEQKLDRILEQLNSNVA